MTHKHPGPKTGFVPGFPGYPMGNRPFLKGIVACGMRTRVLMSLCRTRLWCSHRSPSPIWIRNLSWAQHATPPHPTPHRHLFRDGASTAHRKALYFIIHWALLADVHGNHHLVLQFVGVCVDAIFYLCGLITCWIKAELKTKSYIWIRYYCCRLLHKLKW